MNTKDITISSMYLKVLLYGASGSGKTPFFATVPGKKRLADFDGGAKSARGADIDFDVFPPTDHTISAEFTKWNNATMKDPQWDAIAYDSITSLSYVHELKLLNTAGKADMDLKEYSRLIAWYRHFFHVVTSGRLEKTIFCISHEQKIVSEGGAVRIEPMIIGKKLQGEFPLFFDEVWYMECIGDAARKGRVQWTDFRLHTAASNKFLAKSRLLRDAEQRTFDGPNFEEILRVAEESAK